MKDRAIVRGGDCKWHNTKDTPVPQIVGERVEIEYSSTGGAVKRMTGHSGPPFGVYSAEPTVPYESIIRWRYA